MAQCPEGFKPVQAPIAVSFPIQGPTKFVAPGADFVSYADYCWNPETFQLAWKDFQNSIRGYGDSRLSSCPQGGLGGKWVKVDTAGIFSPEEVKTLESLLSGFSEVALDGKRRQGSVCILVSDVKSTNESVLNRLESLKSPQLAPSKKEALLKQFRSAATLPTLPERLWEVGVSWWPVSVPLTGGAIYTAVKYLIHLFRGGGGRGGGASEVPLTQAILALVAAIQTSRAGGMSENQAARAAQTHAPHVLTVGMLMASVARAKLNQGAFQQTQKLRDMAALATGSAGLGVVTMLSASGTTTSQSPSEISHWVWIGLVGSAAIGAGIILLFPPSAPLVLKGESLIFASAPAAVLLIGAIESSATSN